MSHSPVSSTVDLGTLPSVDQVDEGANLDIEVDRDLPVNLSVNDANNIASCSSLQYFERSRQPNTRTTCKSSYGRTNSSNSRTYEEETKTKTELESPFKSTNFSQEHLESINKSPMKDEHLSGDVFCSKAGKTMRPGFDFSTAESTDSKTVSGRQNHFQTKDDTSRSFQLKIDDNVTLPSPTQIERPTESDTRRPNFAKQTVQDNSSVSSAFVEHIYEKDDLFKEEADKGEKVADDLTQAASSIGSLSSLERVKDKSKVTSTSHNHEDATISFPVQPGSISAKNVPETESENSKVYNSGEEKKMTSGSVCFFCMQSFDSLEELECHEVTHASENPYRCSFCPRIFRSYENRGEHEQSCRQSRAKVPQNVAVKEEDSTRQASQRTSKDRKSKMRIDYSETNDVDFEVVIKEEIEQNMEVDNHSGTPEIVTKANSLSPPAKKGRKKSLREDDDRAHKCPLCPVSFTRNSHLTKHLKNVHSVTGFTCSICKKLCQTKTELEEHEPSHTCDICGKLIKYIGSMEQHKQLHMRGKKKQKSATETDLEKLLCKVCGMKFKYSRSARDHEKRHFEPPIYKCLRCPRKFPTEEKRIKHQEVCQPNIYPCKQCKESFKYNYQLDMHIIEVHTGEYYICEMCGSKFSNKGTWKTHVKLHTKAKEFKCSECQKEFHFKASLKDHMAQVHSDEKPFQCMFCGISLKSKGALKKHEGLHTGAFVFKCEYCAMEYNSRMKLSTHVQEKHTGREFICVRCGKAFTNLRFLRNHELIHTGEKPYKCPHCDARFRRQHHVTQHIPRHFKLTKQLSNYVDIALR